MIKLQSPFNVIFRLFLIATCICCPVCLQAQEVSPDNTPDLAPEESLEHNPSPGRAEPNTLDEEDINAEIQRLYPDIDLKAQHNIRDIKNIEDPAKRHTYVDAMMKVITIWISCDRGSTLEKILDEQYEAKKGYVSYLVISAYFYLEYPPGLALHNDMAELLLQKALELAPESAIAHTQFAYFLLSFTDGRTSEIREHLTSALQQNPNYLEALLLQAHFFTRFEKDFQQAKESCKAIFALKPEDLHIFNTALDLFFEAATEEEIVSFLDQALAANPSSSERARLLYIQGRLQLKKKEWQAAFESGKQALELTDTTETPLFALTLQMNLLAYPLKKQLLELSPELEQKESLEKEDSEKIQQLETQIGNFYDQAIETDLLYISPSSSVKGQAAETYILFLHKRKHDKKALEVLEAYDAKALKLPKSIRLSLRTQIEDLRILVYQLWPWQTWKELADEELYIELERAHKLYEQKPEKYRFDQSDVLKLLTDRIASNDRTLSTLCMKLAALGITQQEESDNKEEDVLKLFLQQVGERLSQEEKSESSEQNMFIVKVYLVLLNNLRKKAGGIVILNDLEKRKENLSDSDVRNYIFATGMDAIFKLSKLESGSALEPPIRVPRKASEFSTWAHKIRPFLEAESIPTQEK